VKNIASVSNRGMDCMGMVNIKSSMVNIEGEGDKMINMEEGDQMINSEGNGLQWEWDGPDGKYNVIN
jgi:hypothetical protein